MSPYYALGKVPGAKSVLSRDIPVALHSRTSYFHFTDGKVLRAEIPFLESCCQQAADPGAKLGAF